MSNETDLLPCPFCGGAASFVPSERGFTAFLRVACNECGASGGSITYSMRENDIDHGAASRCVPPANRKREIARCWNQRAVIAKAAAPVVPPGWKLVPLEPTEDMEVAAESAYEAAYSHFPDWKGAYRAMLAASPPAPAPVVPPGLAVEQEPKYTVNGHAIVNRASGEAVPADEPVFMFRARDVHAREAIEAYACVLPPGAHRDAVVQRVGDFAAFAHAHPSRMKEPDTDQEGRNV